MCRNPFEGLFGPAPEPAKPTVINNVTPAAPPPAATQVAREERKAGRVKSEGNLGQVKATPIAGGGNTAIGIAVGTPDTPRKRTTELGL